MNRIKSPRPAFAALVLSLTTAFAMLASPAASGQRGEGRAAAELRRVLKSFDRLSLDPAELLRRARQGGVVTLKTSRGDLDLEVEPFDIRGEGYRSVAAGAGGALTELPRTPSRSWRGRVRGAEGTHVRLVLDGQKFQGIVVTPSETFFVEPARALSPSAGEKEFVYYAESDVVESAAECGTTLAEQVGAQLTNGAPARPAAALASEGPAPEAAFLPKPEARIATEADFEFFQANGGGESAVNQDILDIFTQVDAVYEAQLGVRLRVAFQRVWSVEADPYAQTGASNALTEFRTGYDQTFTGAGQAPPPRDLAHLFSGKRFVNPDGTQSGIIGIAYISVVCASPSASYGISLSKFSGPGTTVSRRVALTAHELGHNFGAAHPNQVDPVPDACSPSIMNSFIQETADFCQFSRDQITTHVVARAACLTRLAQPGCTYTLTTGPSQFFPGDGAAGSVGVSASRADCVWGIAEGAEWIEAAATGAGSGTLPFTVKPNTHEGPRETVLEAAGQRMLVAQGASASCSTSQIAVGQTVSGALAPSDCRVGRTGQVLAPLDLYTFTARADQRVRIEMFAAVKNSDTPAGQTAPPEALDAFIHLYGPDGNVIASNADIAFSPANSDSALPVTGFLRLPRAGVYTIGATSDTNNDDGAYTLRLSDNSAASTVSFSAPAYAVEEGVAGGGFGAEGVGFRTIMVTRSGDASGAATVDYATADATASGQKDYAQARGTLVFNPNQTSSSFKVFVVDDAFQEGTETAMIALSNPVGTTLGAVSSAALNIGSSNDSATGPSPVRWDSNFNTAFFVRQQYLDFLSREPDTPGFNFWQGDIDNCGADAACREAKRVNVSAAFFLSIEFQNTGYLVYRTYKAAYGDATSPNVAGTVPAVRLDEFLPDTQRIGQNVVVGQGPWEAQLNANKQAYALEFVLRPRFLTAYPLSLTPAQFVDRLSENAGLALTAAERDALVAQFNTTADVAAARASVLRQVADHPALRQAELGRAFVLMQYFGYLRRNPDDAPEPGLNYGGWKFWLGKLDEFDGDFVRAEMVKAFITSFEYVDRFGSRQ